MVIQTNERNANMITIKRIIDHNNLTNYHNAMAKLDFLQGDIVCAREHNLKAALWQLRKIGFKMGVRGINDQIIRGVNHEDIKGG